MNEKLERNKCYDELINVFSFGWLVVVGEGGVGWGLLIKSSKFLHWPSVTFSFCKADALSSFIGLP